MSAAGFVLLALTFGFGSFQLGFRHEGVPGPGLLPLLTSVILLPVGVRLLLRPSLLPGAGPVRAAPLLALALLLSAGAAALFRPLLGVPMPLWPWGG